jgi:hypothetical protein
MSDPYDATDIEVDKFNEWLAYGMSMNWAGPPVCETHDGTPTTIDEDDIFEEGGDPCLHIIRLYDSKEQRLAVEFNHSPTGWRKPS